MGKKLTHEEFLQKLWDKNEHYRNGDFEVIGEENYPFVLVRTKYGNCLPRRAELLKNSFPSILSAVNKNEYCINQFKEKRDFLYDYSLLEYKTQKDRVKIICEKHGIFEQSPDSHKKGIGCWKCGSEKNRIQISELKERLDIATGEGYFFKGDESLTSHIDFTCKLRHKYKQRIIDKLNGNGCPICANITRALYFEKNKSDDSIHKIQHYLYLFQIGEEDFSFYKIGVAKDVKKRISYLKKELYCDVKVLYSKKMSIFEAYTLESFYINFFKDFRYHHPTNFGGVTECFTVNVVQLFNDMSNHAEDSRIQNDKMMYEEYGINYEQQFYIN